MCASSKPILIFLAPDYEKDIKCKCEAFIKVSYQNLVDYVIEPCLMNVSNNQAKSLIENYLRCLSNTTINEILGKKEGRIMAFVGKEKEFFVFLLKPFDEFADTGDDLVAAIDNSIHIADEAVDFVKINHIELLKRENYFCCQFIL